MRFFSTLLTASAIALVATSSLAANKPQAGDWMVRLRAIDIVPDESSTITPIGGKADFSNEVVPELDFSYFINSNIAVELILATAKHDAKAKGTSVSTSAVDVGSAWVLPPTLTVQYHFTQFETFKPYVGAGLSYVMYYNEDAGSQQSLEVDSDIGYALQAGVDIPIEGKWGWNVDVKKIFVDADAKWNGGGIRGNIDLNPWIFGTGVTYRF